MGTDASTEMAADHDLIDRLGTAREDRERAEARVREIGEGTLRDLQDAQERLLTLLGRYEERATGSGNFQAFIEFQEKLAGLVEGLPEDLPEREVFEDVDEDMQKRRLTERDFEAARDALSPVEDLVSRLSDRREARNRVRRLEGRVREAIHETREEISRLETVLGLGEADLDAPIEDLRGPIETYNDSVQDAFETFRTSAPAREVIDLLETAQRYPLLSVREPPEGLYAFLDSSPAGEESIPTLVEYTTFSRSKLAHYVDSPATFQRVVGGNRTYLQRLDADPFTIEWPPPDPDVLRFRADELVSVLDRFASPETIAALDPVLDFARAGDRYRDLRRAARARKELTSAERRGLEAGTVAADLDAARRRLESLEAALDD